ncbi:hypothetical protein SMACR_06668 [Sordaria macrospora]|uniref:WGS project CABT00000000 data, contig 2.13 n=2 Tax=Sordaria macrospora TaxID=5147 RepID=F7VY99_SORMK|nr:uncharacterized protein SMAC_06668 [Sordaria macrospora k-hell]KAA8632573.1 hypothetical protein SMACR_06668 [Sordaria macrospora]KAH7631618.1 hypothetical protein B0T09DRAFT_303178 [Sordaria sp. MPI-SDFR-AT-0083]WPJ62934.1 hypothetical protein SMAC4_06668 [Sordaria macrospora]CCC10493.1 unnamed protein product [Sordaria macrospora k-hell]
MAYLPRQAGTIVAFNLHPSRFRPKFQTARNHKKEGLFLKHHHFLRPFILFSHPTCIYPGIALLNLFTTSSLSFLSHSSPTQSIPVTANIPQLFFHLQAQNGTQTHHHNAHLPVRFQNHPLPPHPPLAPHLPPPRNLGHPLRVAKTTHHARRIPALPALDALRAVRTRRSRVRVEGVGRAERVHGGAGDDECGGDGDVFGLCLGGFGEWNERGGEKGGRGVVGGVCGGGDDVE